MKYRIILSILTVSILSSIFIEKKINEVFTKEMNNSILSNIENFNNDFLKLNVKYNIECNFNLIKENNCQLSNVYISFFNKKNNDEKKFFFNKIYLNDIGFYKNNNSKVVFNINNVKSDLKSEYNFIYDNQKIELNVFDKIKKILNVKYKDNELLFEDNTKNKKITNFITFNIN